MIILTVINDIHINIAHRLHSLAIDEMSSYFIRAYFFPINISKASCQLWLGLRIGVTQGCRAISKARDTVEDSWLNVALKEQKEDFNINNIGDHCHFYELANLM